MTPELKARIETILNSSKVVLFMKGNKSFPQCGFSATAIEILKRTGVPYETVNILQDADVRQGLKEYSDWQTYPQLYVDGKLVGGSDIMRAMYENGELEALLKPGEQA